MMRRQGLLVAGALCALWTSLPAQDPSEAARQFAERLAAARWSDPVECDAFVARARRAPVFSEGMLAAVRSTGISRQPMSVT